MVEGVDVPDKALRRDLVFVERDHGTKRLRRNFLDHDAVCRPVANKHFTLEQLSVGGLIAQVFLDFLFRLAESQRLGLSEKVGQENVMMLANGVQRLNRRNKVARHQLRALMNELIKGMLPIRA